MPASAAFSVAVRVSVLLSENVLLLIQKLV